MGGGDEENRNNTNSREITSTVSKIHEYAAPRKNKHQTMFNLLAMSIKNKLVVHGKYLFRRKEANVLVGGWV